MLTPEPMQPIEHAPSPMPWYTKVLRLCFVIFCFEVGVFLIVFPWLDLWERNTIRSYSTWLADVWPNPFFRGALSGLGFVNICISFIEVMRLIRGNATSRYNGN